MDAASLEPPSPIGHSGPKRGPNCETACLSAIHKALQWVTANVDLLIPFQDSGPFVVREGKSLAELAVMMHCKVQLAGYSEDETERRIVDKLEAAQRNPQFRSRLLRRPEEFAGFSTLYGSLRLLGRDDPEQRELLQRVVDAGLLDHAERVPHRMMEIRLALEWGGLRHSWPGLADLCESSILKKVPCALHLSEPAAYAFTHAIMFFYAFGTAPVPVASPVTAVEGLCRTLSMLVVIYCQERHWDLLGEVLICWDCIGFSDSILHQKAWDTFLSTQKRNGTFPGPEIAPAKPAHKKKPQDAAAKRKAYCSAHYHTTFVAIIAASMQIHRTRTATALTSARGLRKEPMDSVLGAPDHLSSDRDIAVKRVRTWLERCFESVEGDPKRSEAALLYILVGCWICALMDPVTNSATAIIGRVATLLRARDAQSPVRESNAPPTLKLIAGALLLAQGVPVPSLLNFLYESAEVLSAFPSSDNESDLLLYEKRMLFFALGLHPMPAPRDYSEVMRFACRLRLDASLNQVEALLLRIEALTGHGLRPTIIEPADGWLEELLCGFAMHFLRQYNFLMGCRLLRALSYLNLEGSAGLLECVRFLILHQQPDGAFGFFGAEAAALESAHPEGYSTVSSLHLPVSIACLCALAESSSGKWRLLNSVLRIAPPQSDQAS